MLASVDGAGHEAVAQAGGLASPACDVPALADNLLRLCRMDEAERAGMGGQIRRYYETHYRRAEILRRLKDFILNGTV